jgi:hypothetical protein
MPDPISPEELHWLPNDRPWRAAPRTGGPQPGEDPNSSEFSILRDPLYFTKHIFRRAELRLSRELWLHDAGSPEQAEVVRQAVETTLADVLAITKEGALTRRDYGRGGSNDASTHYLFHGPDVTRTWQGNVISMIVRQRTAKPPGIPEDRGVVDGPLISGLINAAITLYVITEAWVRILRGDPVPDRFDTHLIPAGRSFRLDEHCVYYKKPPSEIFGPTRAGQARASS